MTDPITTTILTCIALVIGFLLGRCNRAIHWRRGYSAGFKHGWDRYRFMYRL